MKSIKAIFPVALRCMSFCLLLAAFTSIQANEFKNKEEPDLSELGSAGLFLISGAGIKDAPVLNSAVSVSITGMVAAVNSLLVTIGERKLVGKIRAKPYRLH